jgi:preprotein translocase subunit SecD
MKKIILILFLLSGIHSALAGMQQIAPAPSLSLMLSIVQNQFIINKNNVQSASIIKDHNGRYKGLQLEIKPEFVDAFVKMTQEGVGKTMNIIFNNRVISASVIQSPLSSNILLAGITQEDAQLFIDVLRKS